VQDRVKIDILIFTTMEEANNFMLGLYERVLVCLDSFSIVSFDVFPLSATNTDVTTVNSTAKTVPRLYPFRVFYNNSPEDIGFIIVLVIIFLGSNLLPVPFLYKIWLLSLIWLLSVFAFPPKPQPTKYEYNGKGRIYFDEIQVSKEIHRYHSSPELRKASFSLSSFSIDAVKLLNDEKIGEEILTIPNCESRILFKVTIHLSGCK
jgi:hypothetical protein